MGVYETFSKRRKRLERAGKPDVYQYVDLPPRFRNQVIHIWHTAIGPYVMPHPYSTHPLPYSNKYWELIHETMAREAGLLKLGQHPLNQDPFRECQEFLLSADTDGALDIIEISFRVIDINARRLNPYQKEESDITQSADSAIDELNHRFREHGIGYQFEDGQLVRIDSQYVHDEVVKPALTLLRDPKFQGAQDEFLTAHDHYRHGRHKEAIAEALKAFESTMKTICDARKWPYPKEVTAKGLIDLIFQQGLVPPEMRSHFDSLRSVMESGLPTLRNKSTSVHGQGAVPVAVPDYIAAYALHLAAANIVLLVQAHKATQP